MYRTLDEGAEELLEYFESLGHQVIMVPHDSSKTNCLNFHWHIFIFKFSPKPYLLCRLYEQKNKTIR